MFVAGPALFVRAKVAGVAAPEVLAVTLKEVGIVPAVKVDDVAMPFEPVVCVSEALPLLMNVPSAVDGAVKVTEAPLNGEPFEVTSAENLPNALPTGCGVLYPPACAAIVMVGGGVVEELPQPTRKSTVVNAKIEAIETPIFAWSF